ncbi:hypothetical protein PO407_25300, partial [Escherichia coli]|uniref:hypothetical protein n=1 Tax=Escherichia coli TaxID=562 RepID=UPI001C5F7205
SGYTENQKRRTAARKTKKAAQLRSLITDGRNQNTIIKIPDVYSCDPPATHCGLFFAHRKAPPERGFLQW